MMDRCRTAPTATILVVVVVVAAVGCGTAFRMGYVRGRKSYESPSVSPPHDTPNTNDGDDKDRTKISNIVDDEESRSLANQELKKKNTRRPPEVVNEQSDDQQQQQHRDHYYVEMVLSYWFGKYDTIPVLQSKLWMIPAQQEPWRHTTDLEICHKFRHVVDHVVQDCTNTNHNKETLLVRRSCCPPTMTNTTNSSGCTTTTTTTTTSARTQLARIIVLDQFTRHLHRLAAQEATTTMTNGTGTDEVSSLPPLSQWLLPQATYDQMAYETARSLHDPLSTTSSSAGGGDDDCYYNPMYDFTIPMRIFALLPYRHQNTVEAVSFVQQQIQTVLQDEMLHEYGALIQRFRSATNRRMDGLLLSSSSAAASNGPESNDGADDNNDKEHIRNCDKHHERRDDDESMILEHWPFPADRSMASQHIVYRTIHDFLAEQNHGGGSVDDTLLISLSGGVDSMVIASVVADLFQRYHKDDHDHNGMLGVTTTTKQKNNLPRRLVAVHIDYHNRAESGMEANYVARYCRDTLRIDCHVRRIDEEITRATATKRDEYERISREIRYDAYQQAVATAAAARSNHSNSNPPVIVLLGHHKGDLRENVLSNVHKGCTVLELSGMTKVSRQHGVTLWRPLLLIEKNAIFDYAHTYGVPYFKDTTPLWSTRGKLRTRLLPLLQEVYGSGSLQHLSELAVESDACRDLVFDTVLRPFLDQVERRALGISFATAPWRDHGLFFWKVVLRETLHSAGLGMFSDKMVVSFLERACCCGGGYDNGKKSSIREGWLQCRRDYAVYLQQDGRVFVFYPSTFPWNINEQYLLPTEFIGIDEELCVGPWTIAARKVSERQDEIRSLLQKRAVPSFHHFMNGTVEYYVALHESSGEDKPFSFSKFSKANRPDAWKATDLRIQDTLPLLVPNLVAQATGVNGGPVTLVKVSLTLAQMH